jgi:hypothetical protein
MPTVSGFTLGDSIDLRDITVSGSVLVWTQENLSQGILSVLNGSPFGAVNITLFGQYTTAEFQEKDDGQGGALIIDPPVNPQADLQTAALVNPHQT